MVGGHAASIWYTRPVSTLRSSVFYPLAVNIGLRYANSRRSFISFISIVAIAGLVLSVAVLVLVTSVMNGFERELKERVLGVVPHLTVRGVAPLSDWTADAADLAKQKFCETQGISDWSDHADRMQVKEGDFPS